MKAFAIILAAGRGSRMQSLTAEKPKCLVELGGKALLQWQELAIKSAGIDDIHLVKGYRADCLPERFSSTINSRWAETNMLYSLSCSSEYIKEMFEKGYRELIISYSDIVYHPDHIRKLLAHNAAIGITYDTEWAQLWKLRFPNILADAETFRQEDGLLREIGGKTENIGDICGQYMGLIKMTQDGWKEWNSVANDVNLDIMDMTSFLRTLLERNHAIAAIPVAGKWCEADSETDLNCYEKALAAGNWSHDWR